MTEMIEMTGHRNLRHGAVRRVLCSARVRAALSLGVVLGLGVTGTYAYWTDGVTIAGTSLTAGSIDLKVNGSDTVTGYTSLNISAMVPGNSTAAVLTVSNSGAAGTSVSSVGAVLRITSRR